MQIHKIDAPRINYNPKTLKMFYLQVVTGRKAHPMTPVYGARAMDQVFGAGGMGSGDEVFDLAGFFDVEPPMRITTLASPKMIVTRYWLHIFPVHCL